MMSFTTRQDTITMAKAKKLLALSQLTPTEVLARYQTQEAGLKSDEVKARQEKYGPNRITTQEKTSALRLLGTAFLDPFTLVLAALATVSILTADYDGAVVMILMILLSALLRFVQEYKSQKASTALRQLIANTCAIRREGQTSERPMTALVPGDIITLQTGDLIPADAYLLHTRDLFINQASISGESLPIEKNVQPQEQPEQVFDQSNLVFMGTDVISGQGEAVIVKMGHDTLFGSLARLATKKRGMTQFDQGLRHISKLLIGLMLVLVPCVFIINLLTKGNLTQAFFFAVAVAVGLTPEMLPMVVNSNLAKGATTLSKKKMIVKELRAVQNLGAVDVLCTDKTGTLTQDKVTLMTHLNPQGQDNEKVLHLAYMNAHYQTGWTNLMDQAIVNYQNAPEHVQFRQTMPKNLQKVDEIPFDFNRRRLTVVVKNDQHHWMVTKGAFEEALRISDRVLWNQKIVPLTPTRREEIIKLNQTLNEKGMRVLGITYRLDVHEQPTYSVNDEQQMIFAGLMGFLDPEKADAKQAISLLHENQVDVKILTGDNGTVTQHIARRVGINHLSYIEGQAIDDLSDAQLGAVLEEHDLFVKLNPEQKSRLIHILQKKHTVAYMGDGINDAPALRQSDVGISVDNAADVTKEASAIILLEKSLLVLEDGIIEGRKVYRNTMKYIRMTIASNFGNAFSVLLASMLLPFLPMLSLQILVQNLIYDLAQMSLPWDQVDAQSLVKPTPWRTKGLLRFALIFGPVSTVFDLLTFGFLWFGLGVNSVSQAAVFQTGWFLVGLITQSLIIFVYRTKTVPFFRSHASKPVIFATIGAILLGLLLAVGPWQAAFHFTNLPWVYWLFLPLVVLAYLALSDWLKQKLDVQLN